MATTLRAFKRTTESAADASGIATFVYGDRTLKIAVASLFDAQQIDAFVSLVALRTRREVQRESARAMRQTCDSVEAGLT